MDAAEITKLTEDLRSIQVDMDNTKRTAPYEIIKDRGIDNWITRIGEVMEKLVNLAQTQPSTETPPAHHDLNE